VVANFLTYGCSDGRDDDYVLLVAVGGHAASIELSRKAYLKPGNADGQRMVMDDLL